VIECLQKLHIEPPENKNHIKAIWALFEETVKTFSHKRDDELTPAEREARAHCHKKTKNKMGVRSSDLKEAVRKQKRQLLRKIASQKSIIRPVGRPKKSVTEPNHQ
jgi:hypothetical protein